MRDCNKCAGCPIDGQYKPVQAIGPDDARIVVITEVPTPTGAKEGRLMGKATMGVFANGMQEQGFGRDDFRFVPACFCPYDTNAHTNKEKTAIHKHCRAHIVDEVEAVRPEVVMPLGALPSSQAFGRSTKIMKVKGFATHSPELNAHVFPLMSPGIVTAYPQNAPVYAADVNSFGRFCDAGMDAAVAGAQHRGDYKRIYDLEELIALAPEILAFDMEMTGLRWYQEGVDVRSYREEHHKGSELFRPRAQILTMQFTLKSGEAYILVWDHPEDPIPEQDKPKLRNQLRRLLCNPDTMVVGQNLKIDNVWLWMKEGIRFRISGDTLMLAVLVDENMPEKNLDVLTKIFVPEMAGYADEFNAKVDKSRMWEVPISKMLGYGGGDTDAAFRLYHTLEEKVSEDEGQWNHYCHVTIPGLNALASMETQGMYVDEHDALADFKALMTREVTAMGENLLEQVPRQVRRDVYTEYTSKNKGADAAEKALSLSRPAFLKELLFTHRSGFRLKPKVFTKSTTNLNDESLREPSTSAKDHLPYFFESCPFTEQLAEYIKDYSLLTKSVISFEKKYIVGGKVRPTYHLHKAVTGRCLPGSARVVTNYGSMTMLEVGEFMESRPHAPLYVLTHKNRFKKVTAFIRNGVKRTLSLRTVEGKQVRATGNHPFLTETGWVCASDIRPGDRVYTFDFDFTREEGPEEWREVADDTRYQVSNYGNVAFTKPDGSLRLLSPHRKGEWGHVKVRLGCGGKDASVHRLVAEAFHGAPEEGQECRHLNGIPADNRASNLAWGTSAQNAEDMIRHGRSRRGERSNQCRLTEAEIADIRSRCAAGEYQRDVGASYGIHQAYVSQIVRGIRRQEAAEVFGLSEIVSVRPYAFERTYDISVEDDHSFIAENFVVHNTSSDDPNGQNYPKRGARAKVYRKMFVPPPGYYVCELDLSQAELRIAACMAGDATMIQIYRDAGDIHRATGAIVMGVTDEQFALLPKEEQKEARQKAKAVNFGFLYGMGWRKFIGYAKTQYGVDFTDTEAKRVRTGFFRKYKSLERWHEKTKAFACKHKFVRSFSGRVRHLPMIDSHEEYIQQEAMRQAINSPVQEFGSSLGVMALGRMNEEIDSEYLKVIGFIHDAIVVYVKKEYLDWGMRTVKTYMQTNPLTEWFNTRLQVPIVADCGFGENLGEIHECEGFSLDEPFDYTSMTDKEGNLKIVVPPQEVPPNEGRLARSAYTLPTDLEDESVVVKKFRARLRRGAVSQDTVKRMERSQKQMVINRRVAEAKKTIGVISRPRTRPEPEPTVKAVRRRRPVGV